MKFNDAVTGVLLLALSLAVLVAVSHYPEIPGQQVGPAVFPALVATLLAVCALLMIYNGLAASGRVQPWLTLGAWLRSPYHRRNFAVTVGCLLFYLLASEALGFIPCGVLILAAMFWSLAVRPRLILPLALLITLTIHTVFYKGLRVPLPWGVLQSWQW